MKILHPSKTYSVVTYRREFDYKGHDRWGFIFECNEKGEVDVGKLAPAGLESYSACLTGVVNGREVVDCGVERDERWARDPAVGECNHCSAEVVLYGFTNTCECGAAYNCAGQELAPRECWGEETGEHWSDCY
jgi:hypothetical protein